MKPQLANDEIYHVILRAVGDAKIFNDENDYYRGIFSIYEFNNAKPVSIWLRRQQRKSEKTRESALRCPTSTPLVQPFLYSKGVSMSDTATTKMGDERDKLVEVLVFCFMPNHIHLLLKQVKDNGITNFMKKVGGGYANYFNKKYQRKGHLFNKFKSIHVADDDQLKTAFAYIHTNPLSFIEPGFKEKGIRDIDKAVKFLEEEYRWSSFFDFIDKPNFASVTDRDFISEIIGGAGGSKKSITDWIKYKKKINNLPTDYL